jgi:hypothetical protein
LVWAFAAVAVSAAAASAVAMRASDIMGVLLAALDAGDVGIGGWPRRSDRSFSAQPGGTFQILWLPPSGGRMRAALNSAPAVAVGVFPFQTARLFAQTAPLHCQCRKIVSTVPSAKHTMRTRYGLLPGLQV